MQRLIKYVGIHLVQTYWYQEDMMGWSNCGI